jgi:hypothetical protein
MNPNLPICSKCGIRHARENDHKYNLQYRWWLRTELEKVNRAINSPHNTLFSASR